MKEKEIIIFEPNAGGHQMVWVSRILERASCETRLSIRLVTTSEALSHPSAARIKNLVSDRLQICLINPNREAYSALRRLHPVLQQQIIFSRALSKTVKGDPGQLEHIFIPFFDAYFLWPAVFKPIMLGSVTLSGIVLRTRYHLPSVGIKTELRLHARAEYFAYENILRFQKTIKLFTIDPYFAKFAKSERLTYLRDPADYQPFDRQKARDRLRIPPGHLLVLIFGSIDRRKALKQILEAMSSNSVEGVCILVAGQQSEEIKELMNSEAARRLDDMGKLVQIVKFLNDEEAAPLFAAADLIWSCYANADGSSSVLIKAGRAVRAAVVAPTGIVSKMVADHDAGWIANPSSPASIADVLTEARNNPEKRLRFAHNLHQLFREHTWENFVDPIVQHLVDASRPTRHES